MVFGSLIDHHAAELCNLHDTVGPGAWQRAVICASPSHNPRHGRGVLGVRWSRRNVTRRHAHIRIHGDCRSTTSGFKPNAGRPCSTPRQSCHRQCADHDSRLSDSPATKVGLVALSHLLIPVYPSHPSLSPISLTHPSHPSLPPIPLTHPSQPSLLPTTLTHPSHLSLLPIPLTHPSHSSLSPIPLKHPSHPYLPPIPLTHPFHPSLPPIPLTHWECHAHSAHAVRSFGCRQILEP